MAKSGPDCHEQGVPNGDFRSGYYRDQTFMFAIGALTLRQWFAGLYGHRSCTGTHERRTTNGWTLQEPTARMIAAISKTLPHKKLQQRCFANGQPDAAPAWSGLCISFYRINRDIQSSVYTKFSNKGNRWPSAPLAMLQQKRRALGNHQCRRRIAGTHAGECLGRWSWHFGAKKYQTTKSISEVLKGFQRDGNERDSKYLKHGAGIMHHLCRNHEKCHKGLSRRTRAGIGACGRSNPTAGEHSTSGSHERYKSKGAPAMETDFDCAPNASGY